MAEFFIPNESTISKLDLSKFQLTTYSGDDEETGDQHSIIGLLSELPELSFTINYADGPGATWQSILKSFFKNDLMEIAGTIGSSDNTFNNLINAGEWTKKVYNGYSVSDIALKYRIYEDETFGQTPATRVINLLSKYATLEATNNVSIENLSSNIKNAMTVIAENGKAAGNFIQFLFGDRKDKSKDKYLSTEESVQIETSSNQIYNKLNTALRSIDKKKADWQIRFVQKTNNRQDGYIIRITNVNGRGFGVEKSEDGDNAFLTNIPNGGDNKIAKDDKSKYFSQVSSDEIINEIKRVASKFSNDDIEQFIDNTGVANKIKNIYDSDINNKETQNTVNEIKNILNMASNTMVARYNEYRPYSLYNRKNSLGMKLWTLNIYDNIIFSPASPLIVYVKDWSYKPSTESNINGDPLYYDFEIICTLDQVYSRVQWNRILSTDLKFINSALKRSSPTPK